MSIRQEEDRIPSTCPLTLSHATDCWGEAGKGVVMEVIPQTEFYFQLTKKLKIVLTIRTVGGRLSRSLASWRQNQCPGTLFQPDPPSLEDVVFLVLLLMWIPAWGPQRMSPTAFSSRSAERVDVSSTRMVESYQWGPQLETQTMGS